MPFPSLSPRATGHARAFWTAWQNVRGFSAEQVAQEADRPFTLVLAGAEANCARLAQRLRRETTALPDGDSVRPPVDVGPFVTVRASLADAPPDGLTLDADTLAADEERLAAALAALVVAHPDLRLALARRIPAFRPAVTTRLIADACWENARLAALSALPGVLPLGDLLLPATALGDSLLLTRNQGLLLLRIAVAYGLPADLRARTRELLPVVGGAFGWRAVARELVGLVPGGVGVAVKAAIAYAGTYTVGKAAALYYSTGQTLSRARLKQLYADAYHKAIGHARALVSRSRRSVAPDLEQDRAAPGGMIDKPA